jgi:two-component system, cell cycle response regulator DivK
MKKRILVVEDQEDLRGVLRTLLIGSGYEVIEAADGQAGAPQAKAERPDLILMDIQMPVLDGYEATRQIKADPEFKTAPVIAVSSFAMKGDEEKARGAGCDSYVTSPTVRCSCYASSEVTSVSSSSAFRVCLWAPHSSDWTREIPSRDLSCTLRKLPKLLHRRDFLPCAKCRPEQTPQHLGGYSKASHGRGVEALTRSASAARQSVPSRCSR